MGSQMFEYLTNDYNKLKEEYTSIKELSNQIDQLIEDHGLLDEETMQLLNEVEGNTLEEKINEIIDERNELSIEIRKLQTELNEERKKNANLEEIFSISGELDSDEQIIEAQSKSTIGSIRLDSNWFRFLPIRQKTTTKSSTSTSFSWRRPNKRWTPCRIASHDSKLNWIDTNRWPPKRSRRKNN